MMRQIYTLMAVHAHPDDESSNTGGPLRLVLRFINDVRVMLPSLGR